MQRAGNPTPSPWVCSATAKPCGWSCRIAAAASPSTCWGGYSSRGSPPRRRAKAGPACRSWATSSRGSAAACASSRLRARGPPSWCSFRRRRSGVAQSRWSCNTSRVSRVPKTSFSPHRGSPMTAFRLTAAGLALALAGAPLAAQVPATIPVDTTGVGALIDQGMTKSQVMQNLQYLTDVIGPRLTGSPAARAANDWTLRKFQEYGLTGQLEPWNFGGTWARGPMSLRMVAPRAHDVVAASWAWAPGTNGKTVRGPVVRIDASTPESLEANKAKVKGAWVMLRAASFVWNNDGPPMAAADSERMRAQFRGAFGGPQAMDSARRARIQQFNTDQPFLLRNAGALGILLDAGNEHGLLNMSGSPTRVLPLPQLVVAHEDYALFDRLLQAGVAPRLEARVTNRMTTDSVPQWNTVAEVRGTEHPGEVVIVGAHLDSWDLGTGASDNGTGAMATLEAARIVAQSGL